MKDLSKRTAVIVLNWNKPEMTIECLESLQTMEGEYDIFVIDNGSDKDKRDRLTDEMKKRNAVVLTEKHINEFTLDEKDDQILLLMLLDQNYGYAKGNNYGLRLAHRLGYKYSLISNNDVKIIDRTVLVELIKGIENGDKYALSGPKVIDINLKEQGPFDESKISDYFFKFGILYPVYFLFFKRKLGKKIDLFRKGLLEPSWLSGCFMLLRNDIIYDIGFLDENTFLYLEEAILTEKLRRNSYHIKYIPSVSVLHNHNTNKEDKFSLEQNSIHSHLYYFRNYKNCSQFLCYLAKLSHIFWWKFYLPIINKVKSFIN